MNSSDGAKHWIAYARRMTSSTRTPYQTWNAQLRIALAVLDDGKARDIGAIFAKHRREGCGIE